MNASGVSQSGGGRGGPTLRSRRHGDAETGEASTLASTVCAAKIPADLAASRICSLRNVAAGYAGRLLFPGQPGFRQLPVAPHALRRDSQYIRGLLHCQAPEKTQLDDSGVARIHIRRTFRASSRAIKSSPFGCRLRNMVQVNRRRMVHPAGAAPALSRHARAVSTRDEMIQGET